MTNLMDLLREATTENCITEQESMKKHTTFRIGGPADFFAAPSCESEIQAIVRICREQEVPFYVIGNGSNLLVSDRGYRGLVLQLYRNFSGVTAKDGTVFAQSGAMLSAVARRAQEAGLAGMEFASGIPGTIGGAVVMNAGAYGGEMKDILVSVRVLTRENEIREVPASALALGYRTSTVAKNGWIILGAKLALSAGDADEILARMEELRMRRIEKQPLDLPSAGSTFKRPEGQFAGKLIMDAGLRGFSVGGAQISEKHCGFVVNRKDATAEDVRALIREVQRRVREHSGVTLEPEVRMLGEF